MRTKILMLVATLTAYPTSVRSDSCDGAYAACMSGCATQRMAERCMQNCQGARTRCEPAARVSEPLAQAHVPIPRRKVGRPQH
jgi:hypothetical protein